jgi:Flp pilus assembly protein protease CpaA
MGLWDFFTYRIPDFLIVSLCAYGFLENRPLHLICACFMVLLLSALRTLGKTMRGYVMLGYGDIKMMGACSLFLPFEALSIFLVSVGLGGLVLACLLRTSRVPLAPAIATGFWMAHSFPSCQVWLNFVP